MPVSVTSMEKLFGLSLSAEQLKGVMEVLAVELAPLERIAVEAEERRSKDRARKRRGDSADVPRNIQGSSTEIPRIARDGDILSKNSTLELSLPPSIPPSPPETPFWREFIEAYPKREGGMDEAAAEKGFAAACRRTDPQVIIAGAKAYHAEMSKQQKIGTQFILKPRKWLNDCGWTNYQPKAVTPIQPRVTVFEGTPAWEAHKRANPRLTARDLKDEHGRFIGRGWYFPTEYPEQERAA